MRPTALRALLAALLALFAIALAPGHAAAAGSVQIKDREPKESDGKWKLVMTMDYGSTPHLNHIPMLFTFTATALYERSLTDESGDKPVERRIPLSNQTPINLSMDVGFSDGSGKTFQKTKFDFVINRDKGFEAGEYTLKITRSSDGAQMGPVQNIKLKGDNPVVDRRAIVFTGEKKKKDKPAEGSAGAAPAGAGTGDAPAAAAPGGDPASTGEGSTPPEASGETPTETPEEVPPRQGGCGCRTAGDKETSGAAGLAIIALAALGARYSRRRFESRRAA